MYVEYVHGLWMFVVIFIWSNAMHFMYIDCVFTVCLHFPAKTSKRLRSISDSMATRRKGGKGSCPQELVPQKMNGSQFFEGKWYWKIVSGAFSPVPSFCFCCSIFGVTCDFWGETLKWRGLWKEAKLCKGLAGMSIRITKMSLDRNWDAGCTVKPNSSCMRN